MTNKKKGLTYRNPVARDMLQERKSPQVIPPKKGNKAVRNRKKEKQDAIRDNELWENYQSQETTTEGQKVSLTRVENRTQ